MQDVIPKIYLSMILKDDEPIDIVKRGITIIKDHIDGLYITITYKDIQPSTSPLIDYLNSIGAHISFFKWTYSFADARNHSLDQIPKDKNTFFTWMDADDIHQNPEKMRGVVDLMVKNNIASVFVPYWYQVELDEQGAVKEILIEHKRERLIRNDGTFKWIGMLHETLIEQRVENVIKIQSKDFVVIHLSDRSRMDVAIERNVEILEKQAAQEQHKDPRTLVYLAKAYTDKGKMAKTPTDQKLFFEMALMLFTEYLEGAGTPGNPGYIEGSGWPEERGTAWSYVAEISIMNGQYNTAIRALMNALIEAPAYPMHYVTLAMVYTMVKDYVKAKHWLSVATNVPEPDTTLIQTPRDLKIRALEVDYNIALGEGRIERAVEDSKLICSITPNDKMYRDRLEMVTSILAANQASQSIVYLGKYLEQIKEPEKIPYLVQAVPRDLQIEKFASEMRHRFNPSRVWADNEIAILCGPGFEQWSPKSIKTGLGGSEEAVVYLSRELKRLGWQVTVYANPMKDEGDHDGIMYRQWWDLNTKDRFNVLIMWRNIGFLDVNPQARFKMMWSHDVPTNPDFTEERIKKIDKIAVMSEYHKSLFRMQAKDGSFVKIPDDKFLVTANGILLPVDINKKWKRDTKKLLYASSYDRGLIYLLNNWPLIKKGCPDAKLDIYYGWNLYDTIHANNPARMRWKHQVADMMKQDGITHMGRVGHSELNKAYATAGVWAYPTDFTEISCISAMKAQAYGAIPVVTNFAALKETVKNGKRIDVDIMTNEGQKTYVEELIKTLNNTEEQEKVRPAMMKFAQEQFGWNSVAKTWDELFKSCLGK